MDAKVVNALIGSVYETIRDVLRVEPKLGRPSAVTHISIPHSVVTVIGITGGLDGSLIYSFSSETALKVVSAMMSMEYNQLDDLAMSAIGELGNMTAGKLAMKLEGLGKHVDITPPTVVSGRDLKIKSFGAVLKLPISVFSAEDFDLHLSVKNGG
ncbi:chemotaxis protein CheX [Thermotoga sp. KOL6]|uniref:chemotaxis protein CheX n=1 Tax=Thermotoga sp. KOL6 TaxID=126741 RepID=UPI000C77F919|nr:chemotaxis protein CheX [Thermotoga sp. KOL6]PLV60270.1 CheY-P-specific phosphatase CheX [Thermotoga sp. KOL6]